MEATASLLFSLRKRTSGEEDEEQRKNAALVVVVIFRFLRVRVTRGFVCMPRARGPKSDRSKDGGLFFSPKGQFFSETLSNTVGKSKKRTTAAQKRERERSFKMHGTA